MPSKTDPFANIPEGREAEFLTDAQLAEFHKAKLDAAKPSDPGYDALRVNATRAARAAALSAVIE